jgi:hypothetical protein
MGEIVELVPKSELERARLDIADYLKQAGQTAGHRELWRLLNTLLKQDNDADQVIE